jgi:hypothetical protein
MTKKAGKVSWDVRLRKVSEPDRFPFAGRTVTFIKIDPKTMTVTKGKTIKEKQQMLLSATDEGLLLAAWPGEWSQDVFEIDNRKLAIEALS